MMKMTTIGAGAAIALTLAIGLAAQTPEVFKRTMLQQVPASMPGYDVVQAVADIEATGGTGRHTHPGDEISYVMAGSILLEVDGKPARTVKAGEAFVIPAGIIHSARHAGTGTAKVVVAYVVERGKPVTTPAK